MRNYQKKLILLSLVMIMIGCNPILYNTSTSSQFRGLYNSSFEEGEIEIYPWYHYVKSKKGNTEYVFRSFYPETKQITSYMTFASIKFKTLHGLAIRWFDDGSKEFEGNFKDGKRDGLWRFFHSKKNGKFPVSRIGQYQEGEEEGTWKDYDGEGRLLGETDYLNGLREGPFIVYDTLANIVNKGIYKSDTIFQEKNPKKVDVFENERMPEFGNCDYLADSIERRDCSQKRMLEYIYRSIKYPHFARSHEVQGSAIIRFCIDKDGSVQEIKVLRGICQSIAEECKRVVREMPDWHQAGMQNGKAVKVYFNLPIRFNLE